MIKETEPERQATLGWSATHPQMTRPMVLVIPMMDKSLDAESLSTPFWIARAVSINQVEELSSEK